MAPKAAAPPPAADGPPDLLPGEVPIGRTVWSTYSVLDSVDNAKIVAKVQARAAAAPEGFEWVATEKVHGANFAFETDGVTVEYASRTRKLAPGADFYDAFTTMPVYHPFVLEAFRLLKEWRPDLQLRQLLIYGEYFGGWHPSRPQVKGVKGLKIVQKGVAYSPDHHFYAFDVSPNGAGFLDFEEASRLLSAAGFPLVATPVLRGTLHELLAFDVEAFQTTLPPLLGFDLSPEHSIAEGIVIRPARESQFPGGGRGILKKKARAFWEATNQHSVLAKKVESADTEAPGAAVGGLLKVAQDLMVVSRLLAVISKDPELLRETQLAKLAGLFTQDVWNELGTRCEEQLQALGEQVAELRKGVGFLCRKFAEREMPGIRMEFA